MILNAGMLLRTVEVFDKKSKMDFGNCLLYGYYWDKDLKEESEDIFLDWVSRQAEKISSLLETTRKYQVWTTNQQNRYWMVQVYRDRHHAYIDYEYLY